MVCCDLKCCPVESMKISLGRGREKWRGVVLTSFSAGLFHWPWADTQEKRICDRPSKTFDDSAMVSPASCWTLRPLSYSLLDLFFPLSPHSLLGLVFSSLVFFGWLPRCWQFLFWTVAHTAAVLVWDFSGLFSYFSFHFTWSILTFPELKSYDLDPTSSPRWPLIYSWDSNPYYWKLTKQTDKQTKKKPTFQFMQITAILFVPVDTNIQYGCCANLQLNQ